MSTPQKPAGSLQRVEVGVSIGLLLTAAVTVLRWQTWQPYRPVMLPFDALLLVGAAGIACLLGARLRLPLPGWLGIAVFDLTIVAGWIFTLDEIAPHALSWKRQLLVVAPVLAAFALPRARAAKGPLPFALFAVLGVGAWLGAGRLGWTSGALLFVPSLVLAASTLVGVRLPRDADAAQRSSIRLLAVASLIVIGVVAIRGTAMPEDARDPRPVAPSAPAAARPGQASLVLIVLDTLRRDHMSLYGYARQTTPRLDAWSADARVFDSMIAMTSWTLPSHASMFTGLYSRSHGAHGYRSDKKDNSTYRLGPDFPTLASRARAAGLATGAIVANHYFLGPEFGLDLGFDDYLVPRPRRGFQWWPADALARRIAPASVEDVDWPYYRAHYITDLATEWIEEQGDRPFFLFVNYLDVHRPNRRPPTPEVPLQDEAPIPLRFPEITTVLEHQPLDPRVRRGLVNGYDRELFHLDREIDPLLEFLDDLASRRDLYVIVTSDHGEFFGEHDLVDHMMHVYNEVVNVPLIIKGPGVERGRSANALQSVDILATALDLLQIDGDRGAGVSAFSSSAARPVVAEWYAAANGRLREPRFEGRFERDVTGYAVESLRLIEYEDGEVELYDTLHDPGETQDIAQQRPEDVARLQQGLRAWREKTPEAPAHLAVGAEVDPETLEQLKQLGYVGDE